jgi:hypothetical protein
MVAPVPSLRPRPIVGFVVALGLVGCKDTPRSLDALAPRAVNAVVTLDDPSDPGAAGLNVSLFVRLEPPCEPLARAVSASFGGAPLALVEPGHTNGDAFSRGGARCEEPRFGGMLPTPGGSGALLISDATAHIEAAYPELALRRTLRLETPLRAGAEAVIVWSPAGDLLSGPGVSPMVVRFEPAGGAAAWEVIATTTDEGGARVHFSVPASATAGPGRLSAGVASDGGGSPPRFFLHSPATRCVGVSACNGTVLLPRGGVSMSATVVAR